MSSKSCSVSSVSAGKPIMLQVCCSVLQCVAGWCSVVRGGAGCCSLLQCVAECCRVLQGVAVCYSVWQCVAVCT